MSPQSQKPFGANCFAFHRGDLGPGSNLAQFGWRCGGRPPGLPRRCRGRPGGLPPQRHPSLNQARLGPGSNLAQFGWRCGGRPPGLPRRCRGRPGGLPPQRHPSLNQAGRCHLAAPWGWQLSARLPFPETIPLVPDLATPRSRIAPDAGTAAWFAVRSRSLKKHLFREESSPSAVIPAEVGSTHPESSEPRSKPCSASPRYLLAAGLVVLGTFAAGTSTRACDSPEVRCCIYKYVTTYACVIVCETRQESYTRAIALYDDCGRCCQVTVTCYRTVKVAVKKVVPVTRKVLVCD